MASRLAPEDWQRIKTILDEALDVPPAERAAFIEARCAGDEALRHEVVSLAAADSRSVDGRLGVAMARHNIGEARAGLGDTAGALEEFDRARRLYEPIVEGDPGNAWAAGSLAGLYLAIGKEKEKVSKAGGSDAGESERLEEACRFYARANRIYERLSKSGRLTSVRAETAAEAAGAAARCRTNAVRPVPENP